MVTRSLKIGCLAMLPVLVAVFPAESTAKPGTLAQSPLFLAEQVKSNILFVLDDSGSMDWEVLKSEGARSAYTGSSYPDSGDLDITPSRNDSDEILESCAGYNVLYYDPNVTYTPWYGVDENGDVFTDQDITAARINPYIANKTIDLTVADGAGDLPGYMTWNDLDGDGEFDKGECPDPKLSGYDYKNQFTATTSGPYAANVMTPEQQTNFANWYTYYRKREYVMKRAVSQLIYESSNRMGLTTLHNNNKVATPVDDVSDESHRDDLLENLFKIYSSGGTPLRWALEEAGEYFSQVDGFTHSHMTSESSPILPKSKGGACQQNFAILMSDGYWNGSTPDRAGNADGDNNSEWDGGAMADGYKNTLADVAMYYYENDLSNLDDEVRTITGVDENPAQHMVTFSVAFGVNGTISEDPPNRTDSFSWPNPLDKEDQHRVDDMRHAAFNSRGQFLNAKDPSSLIASLNAAIAEIESRVGSASSVSFNSAELTEDTVIYRASFNSSRWSGDLQALPLDPITGVISHTPDWSAQDQLDAQSTRTILTYDGTDGAPFTWSRINDASSPIKPALYDLMSDNAGGTLTEEIAEARLEYIRGDRSNEGTSGYGFRTRLSRLGDIVHSSPVYVGKPVLNWPDHAPFPSTDGEKYSDFKAEGSAAATRQPVVYVGANDGMLHGFETSTGNEVLAYIPSMLFSENANEGLHYYTDENYLHRYYVDLDPVLSDVYITTSATDTTPSWRTVLIGGLRAGGRGIYALDVTDPSNFGEDSQAAKDIVLWEFSGNDDPDLGHTFSRPTIVMLNNGEWAAILGNGYNDTGDGEAKLFILFLEEGLDGWDSNDYVEITTKVGNTTDRNGLSTPVVADLDGNGTADRVYAGDLEGNMWAFDISASNPASWKVAYKDGSDPAPLFTAANGQPITAKPALSKHPYIGDLPSNAPNVMVYFGTGQYMTTADRSDTSTQTLYGVWDMGDDSLTRSDLVEQKIDTSYVSGTVVTDNLVDYSNGDYGWYFDLPVSGERVITTPLIWAGNIYFNSLLPEDDPCTSGATGILTALDLASGGRTAKPAFDANNDGVVDNKDKIKKDGTSGGSDDGDGGGNTEATQGRKTGFGTGTADAKQLGANLYSGDPNEDKPLKLPPDSSDRTGRLSWQELFL